MAVTRADIQRIAELAELAVDDAAAAELERQLSRILDHVAQLQALPQGDGAAASEPAVRLRRDEVKPDVLAAGPETFAPRLKHGLFLVPRVAELAPGTADE